MKLFTKISTMTALALSLTLGASATEAPNTELVKPLLNYTSVEQAKDDVKAVYAEIKAAFGIVPEPIKGLSLNPAMLRNTWDMYKIMGSNKNFSPKTTTMMRYLVAEANHCEYCVGFNKGMMLNIFKMSEDEINALQKDPSTAKLDEKQKAMLLFMLKSTSHPTDVNQTDIDVLKNLGWSETDIMEGVKQATEMVATSLFIDTFKIQ
jgi:uncharacterized peroxidase-related enzyme